MSRTVAKYSIAAGVLGVIAIVIWAGFKREYVIPASGLLDVKTGTTPGEVVVSGVLLSSMSHVTKTTAEPYRDGVIVRVYVDLIGPDDDLNRLKRAFSCVVPRSKSIKVIYLGDSQEWETVGKLYGVPVRVPRHKEWAAKVVWRATT